MFRISNAFDWRVFVFFIACLSLLAIERNFCALADERDDVIAEGRKHWAFQKLARPDLPQVRDVRRVRSLVDAFVLKELETRKLTFAAAAERLTLVRRAYLDLIGLPPSPEQIDDFLNDKRPNTYELLIDRLLASPHFGERWGRHWLDVVGYVDTVGFDIDANLIIMPEGKWKYRHYVIRSFNADKPYGQFVREQLAGDEMIDWRNAAKFNDEIRDQLIATGFLRTAQDFTHEPESFIKSNMYNVLYDTIEIVGSSLMGLTLQCCRCHDHKFDPVLQQDYYELMACLTPAYNPDKWKAVYSWKPEITERGLPDVSPAEQAAIEKHNAPINQSIAELNKQIGPLNEKAKQNDGKSLTETEKSQIEKLKRQIAELEGRRRGWGKIQALYNVDKPPATRLLNRGNFRTPGDEVQPAFLRVLSETPNEGTQFLNQTDSEISGRRTALAKTLTQPGSRAEALLARVIVNRIWQHLFGRGLVPTADNFGINGQPPTHAELLEWLSREFLRNGSRIKPLIRQIMVSTVYRQSSVGQDSNLSANPQTIDPENRLLWHMPLRRLESEVIRDSILSVSGTLDSTMGGEPIQLKARKDGLVVADIEKLPYPAAKWRRSVYLLTRRQYNHSILTTFDQPAIATTCAQRKPSAVVSQSLMMMNDAFVFDQSERFADAVTTRAGLSRDGQIKWAFRLALCRAPSDEEKKLSQASMQKQAAVFQKTGLSSDDSDRKALVQLCHTLLNTSEFLYAE